MLFNSYEFAALMVLTLVGYYGLSDWRTRKAVLIVASYTFYGAWNPPYLFLLLATTGIDFRLGLGICAARNPMMRRLLLVLSCAANLSVLAFFKYGDFLLTQVNGLLAAAAISPLPHYSGSLITPLGLSFYTFQSIGYVTDVYRREIVAARSWWDYMLFVSFFPQLEAGPILRAKTFLPQLETAPHVTSPQIAHGAHLIVLGLFQKVVIADNIAPLVNVVFNTPGAFQPIDKLLAIYGFAFEIYFDFAGYSNIAIGLASLLGFSMPANFRLPYVARGFRDFWTRWHVSLSSWLRDYLYIPLGGNRGNALATCRNLMLTMLLGGLWHGASWTFVVWGALHGTYLIGERIFGRLSKLWPGRWREWRIVALAEMILTFQLICLGWVFFRSDGIKEAFSIIGSLNHLSNLSVSPAVSDRAYYVLFCIIMLVVGWIRELFWKDRFLPAAAVAVADGAMLAMLILLPGGRNAFIYFQF